MTERRLSRAVDILERIHFSTRSFKMFGRNVLRVLKVVNGVCEWKNMTVGIGIYDKGKQNIQFRCTGTIQKCQRVGHDHWRIVPDDSTLRIVELEPLNESITWAGGF